MDRATAVPAVTNWLFARLIRTANQVQHELAMMTSRHSVVTSRDLLPLDNKLTENAILHQAASIHGCFCVQDNAASRPRDNLASQHHQLNNHSELVTSMQGSPYQQPMQQLATAPPAVVVQTP